MLKYGVQMDLPEGKRAGYYAQIVKSLADAATLFDRDKELIVLDDLEARDKTAKVLEKYGISWEPLTLLLLPEGTRLTDAASDYGFVSKFGYAYLYGDRVERFRIPDAQRAGADFAPALAQLEEFIVFVYGGEAAKTYCCEPHLKDTVEGVARRYGVEVQFLQP